MTEQVRPPFTGEQVASINGYQVTGAFHPFTCGTVLCRNNLVATHDGLRCPKCDFRQLWVWAWMADWSWRGSTVRAPLKGWWKLYPVRGNGWVPHPPGSGDHPDPQFLVGATVQLRGKPELVRQVLAVEWHWIRREFIYIVETSAAGTFRPYWFAAQLVVAKRATEEHVRPQE